MLRFHLLFPCRSSLQISAHLQLWFLFCFVFITVSKRTFTSLVIISSHQLYFSIDLGNSVPGLGAVSHGILLQQTLHVQKAEFFVDTLMSAPTGLGNKE